MRDVYNTKTGAVLMTDSLSGIELLKSRSPKTYIHLYFKIHRLVLELNTRLPVKIQFVPGHHDIKGNELADAEAKAAHR